VTSDTPPAAVPTQPSDPDATIAPRGDPLGDTVTKAPGAPVAAPQEAAAVPGFVLEGELGRGGMGVVYRARQVPLNRPVALKMVLSGAHADPKDRARFLTEAEAVAAVRHPHVVQVFEFGEHDGRPYFAMEYLDGGSLAGLLRSRGKLSPAEAATLVEQCARGVQAAHDLGIVHRDLKPGNVLLDAAGEPKVTDFGLAKRGGKSDLTCTGAVMGTPAYMAPEQAKGEGKFVGPGADVYALGVILYECLAGRTPFRADETVALLMQVATDEAPPVRRFAPEVPRDLDLICQKCLAKGPHERYATAGMLADELGRFLRGEPVTARPVGPAERVVKWVRRNPAIATAAAVVMVAIVGGTGVAFWQAVEARRAEKLAQARLQQQEKANELMLSIFRGLKPPADGETTPIEKSLGDQLDQVTP
jgi:predicted Ser/Thr protein kinase